MSMYSIDQIAQWELGKNSLCVIVEGMTHADDVYFFEQWFGGSYPSITFYHQNGYAKVTEAVANIRANLAARKSFTPTGKPRVYGITDRDFNDVYLQGYMPGNGVLRMTKCMLENYFLDPQPWSVYFWENTIQHKLRRERWDAAVWGSPDKVQTIFRVEIERIYRANLEVSAYNWTLFEVKQRFPNVSTQFPDGFPPDLDRPGQYQSTKLAELSNSSGIPITEINDIFNDRLTLLQSMNLDDLAAKVQGKALYHQFYTDYLQPTFSLGGKVNEMLYDVASNAMRCCVQPPQDLDNLIAFIEQFANTP